MSLACPWAHRTVIIRMLKDSRDAVSMSVVEPLYGPHGWKFGAMPGATADTANGKTELAEIYLLADPRFTGRVTVPVLWDKERRTIVNNESAEIIRMLNSAFGRFNQCHDGLLPAVATHGHRSDQRARLRHRQQRRLSHGLCEHPGGL